MTLNLLLKIHKALWNKPQVGMETKYQPYPSPNRRPLFKSALVYWLLEETHVLKALSLNPHTLYWMDIFSLICCQNCNFCLKMTEKEADNSPFKKHVDQAVSFTRSLFKVGGFNSFNSYLLAFVSSICENV